MNVVAVKNHFYHADFHGSFSIKNVVPALLPEMTYDQFDVADGMAASHLLESVLCHPDQLSAEQCENLRTQLRTYCEHDTAVMVELLRFLQALAPRAG